MDNLLFQVSQLIHRVSDEADPEKQIKLIVDSISSLFDVDVCSLYLLNEQHQPTLYATHGLQANKPISLQEGTGLVGKVINSKVLINVPNAAVEEGFQFLPETGENAFSSFCCVPLVKLGDSVGALVVQSIRCEKLPEQYEALLVTLAAQLSWIVPDVKQLKVVGKNNIRLPGAKGAPGVAVAEVYILSSSSLEQVQIGECADIKLELATWRELKTQTLFDLNEEKEQFRQASLDDSLIGLFDAYQLLLDDPALTQFIESAISEGADIPTAVKKSFLYFSDAFRAMEDPYLASRADDLIHLGNKILTAFNNQPSELSEIPNQPVILFGADISISEIAGFPDGLIAGIVCTDGSHLSHTAVLANALGIPAVLGIGRNVRVSSGELLVLDADNACVIQYPTKSICAEYRKIGQKLDREAEELKKLRDIPAVTLDGKRIHLMANSGLVNDITPSIESGAEGIGLYRTEIPFMTCQAFPNEAEQVMIYAKIFSAFKTEKVYMRLLDIGGDKQLPYYPITDEFNPALGWRGIRFGLDNAHILLTQIRAMLIAAGEGEQLHILIPMVSSKEQLIEFKKLLDEGLKQLTAEGVAVVAPKVGCMIEIPAAISQIPFWAQELDFVSIGSNDLSQYLLSVDRNNARVACLYDPLHPAVIHEIFRAVRLAQTSGLEVSLCGELASEPLSVVLLIGMGLTSLSLGAAYLPRIKKLVLSVDSKESESLLQEALLLHSADDIRHLLNEYMKKIGWE